MVQEAKKEAMETSRSSAAISTSKPKVTSFFPLQKLKGSQPTVTPSTRVLQLEEKSTNEEEGINSEDQDGLEGMTEEFIVCLVRAVKDTQQIEMHCYHCDSPDHFIHNCPQLAKTKAVSSLNWKEGMVPRKGTQAPQGKVTIQKVSLDGKMSNRDSLLESQPL